MLLDAHDPIVGTASGPVEPFLRSINIAFEAEHPERLAHFQPTAKSLILLRALLGLETDRAFIIIAPYGSGKSLAASYLLHLIENRPSSGQLLRTIEDRLDHLDVGLAQFSRSRRQHGGPTGLVLPLAGYHSDLNAALKSAAQAALARTGWVDEEQARAALGGLNDRSPFDFLEDLGSKLLPLGCDRIVILWDEFGRHVQTLLAEGKTHALHDLQLLAEMAARSSQVPMTLGLLLHQSVGTYTGHAPQSVRRELTKIEGRFRVIQYFDDSKEAYHLIAEVVSTLTQASEAKADVFVRAARECRAAGLFSDFDDQELTDLLATAYPLEPATLFLLPRLAARVAQNERTVFSFLQATPLSQPVGPDALYDYFAPAMRADTAVGGTYRQWLETESALVKAADLSGAHVVLKAACLLALGAGGERARASRDSVLLALRGYRSNGSARTVVKKLVDRKLLLHRRHSDELTVWHGTDLDLRSKLEDRKQREREAFDVLCFLQKEAPPPVWRPVRYNADYRITRFLTGEFHSADSLASYLKLQLELKELPLDCDGRVLYILIENQQQVADALASVQAAAKRDRLITAIPREPLPLMDAALEVHCLLQLQQDADLISLDPLVLPELQQMIDDSRSYLQRLLDRLLRPAPDGPRWFHQGEEFPAESDRDLRHELSKIMRLVYGMTPRINNEMMVRQRPSSVVVNARKKLLLGILERSGSKDLGITGNFPDASALRTVLINTKLYAPLQDDDDHWGYVPPEEIQDLGLREVWSKIREFLSLPAEQAKQLKSLMEELQAPPHGVRAGVIPILLAAGLKAFPSVRSLTRDGEYVTDILPSEIEQLCREPERYRLRVLGPDRIQIDYLRRFLKCFEPQHRPAKTNSDLVRACFEALERWKTDLPSAAMATTKLSDAARRFRAALRVKCDPTQLILEEIPNACDLPIESTGPLLRRIRTLRKELERVSSHYQALATASVNRVLGRADRQPTGSLRDAAVTWAGFFPKSFVDGLLSLSMGRALLDRMGRDHESDESLLDSLAVLLIGKDIRRWDDTTLAMFERSLQDAIHSVEDAALAAPDELLRDRTATTRLAGLLRSRMEDLFLRLSRLQGEEKARAVLDSIGRELPRGESAKRTRSSRKHR
jgi:hypothetical protein